MARYVEHSGATSDPRLFAYWEALRRNEAEHRDLLTARLRALGVEPPPHDGRAPRGSRAPGGAPGSGGAPESGGAQESGGAPGFTRDLAALRADHGFEDAAVKRYGQMANEVHDPGLKELFKELATGEAGHRRGLRRMIADVEDPGTPLILFCPLCGWEIDFGPGAAEGTTGKCPMCPGKFALQLDAGGDWALERLAP